MKERIESFLTRLVEKLLEKCAGVMHRMQGTMETLSQGGEKADRIIELINENGDPIRRLFRHAAAILKHICPRKGSADVHFGSGDPYSTAKAGEIYCFLQPLIGEHIRLKLNMDEKEINAEGNIRGRICLAIVLWHGLLVYFDRQLRKLYGDISETIENKEA